MPLQIHRPTARRRLLIALGAGALAAPLGALAQQLAEVRRIGCLAVRSRSTPSKPEIFYDSFMQGMRELGYVEGKNVVSEWRFADGKFERLPVLPAELVRLNPEVIATHSTQATEALQRATRTIPIVTNVTDPVASGFAARLARPGGNITGMSIISADLSPKQLELLKAMVPKLSRVAVLMNPNTSSLAPILKSVQAAGQTIGVRVLPVETRNPEETERGFAAMKQDRADAVIILADAFFIGQRRQIAELATKARIPTIAWARELVEAGGLMSYGQNLADNYRHAATYVDKILKGAKPGELPIEQPMKIHFVINRKTANALGLTIPRELLLRADEVIE